jgi:hypothetical protein
VIWNTLERLERRKTEGFRGKLKERKEGDSRNPLTAVYDHSSDVKTTLAPYFTAAWAVMLKPTTPGYVLGPVWITLLNLGCRVPDTRSA